MKKYGKEYIYIYNPNQKDFYLSEGCQLIDADIHSKTKNPFWVFKYNETQEAFSKWCIKSKELKCITN